LAKNRRGTPQEKSGGRTGGSADGLRVKGDIRRATEGRGGGEKVCGRKCHRPFQVGKKEIRGWRVGYQNGGIVKRSGEIKSVFRDRQGKREKRKAREGYHLK